MSAKLVAILLLSSLWGGWYFLRARNQSAPSNKPSPPKFPGVAIGSSHGVVTCAAMQQLDGKRFLPDEAPMLPLAECDVERCNCCYVRYRDRRSDGDRRSLYGSNNGFVESLEHRGGDGRRVSDNDDEDVFIS